ARFASLEVMGTVGAPKQGRGVSSGMVAPLRRLSGTRPARDTRSFSPRDLESTAKKARHRRYADAPNLKRGPDLDSEALFTDLEGQPAVVAAVVDDPTRSDLETDLDGEIDPRDYLDDQDEEDYRS